jgi:putative MATE family efflux protein
MESQNYSLPSNFKIWRISYPIILGFLAQNILNLADTAFLGRLGEVELGAAAIGGLYYIALYMLGFGLSTGAQILIGKRNGSGMIRKIGRVFDQGLVAAGILSILVFLFIYIFTPWLLSASLSSEEVFAASDEYLSFRKWGIFFAFFNVMVRAMLIGIMQTRVITISAIITAGSNIVLDYLLIFGHGGFPEMGIGGAALASVIAEALGSVYLFWIAWRPAFRRKYRLFRFTGPRLHIMKRLLKISFPVMLQYFLSLGGWFIFFMIVEQVGKTELAVSNVVRGVYLLMMMHVWALAGCASSLTSNAIGAMRSDLILPIARKVSIMSMVISIGLILIALPFTRELISLFTNDPHLIDESVYTMYTIYAALPLLAVAAVLFNVVSGTGATRAAFVMEGITIVVYLIFSYFAALAWEWPLYLLWTNEFVYVFIMAAFAWWYLKRFKSKGNTSSEIIVTK